MTGDKATGTNQQVTRPKTASSTPPATAPKAPKRPTTATAMARKATAVTEPATQVTKSAKTAKNTAKAMASKKTATAVSKPAPTKRSRSGRVITAQERWRMISENAYYRAESRGFMGGSPAEDWATAEAEIDAELARTKTVVQS